MKRKEMDTPSNSTDTPPVSVEEGSSDGKKLKVIFDTSLFCQDDWKKLVDVISKQTAKTSVDEIRKLYEDNAADNVINLCDEDEKGKESVDLDAEEAEEDEDSTALDGKLLFGARACLRTARNHAVEVEFQIDRMKEHLRKVDPSVLEAQLCLGKVFKNASQVERQMDRTKVRLEKFESTLQLLQEAYENNRRALKIIEKTGCVNGGHHKQWILDQVVRSLLSNHTEAYEAWVRSMTYITHSDGEEEEVYEWDTGIIP